MERSTRSIKGVFTSTTRKSDGGDGNRMAVKHFHRGVRVLWLAKCLHCGGTLSACNQNDLPKPALFLKKHIRNKFFTNYQLSVTISK